MTIDFITQEKDYWVASNAINITLNALSDPNRIQCSVSSGAVVRCFYEHIDEADSLGYTVAHDYHQWPISSSPTYFNSNTEKYVYIAIPRSAAVGVQAIVVFPSDKLDIYGRKAVKSTDPETGEETIVYEQIGSTDYFYVWLQATISAPLLIGGVLQRIWTTQIATGKLNTPQGDAERETDSEWYLWSAIGGFVTFLREIRMSVDSWFANIRLGKDKRELTGVATADTADEFVDSETLVVTPSYLKKNTEDKFLRKDQDDATPYSLGVGEDLTVGGDVDVTGQERVDVVQSHNYSGSGLADTGFLITNDNGSGDSLGVFDYLTVRKKMIINSLEIKETHFSAGDVAHTLASAEIARTDYFYVDEEGNRELLGYSTILVPWSLRGGLLALAKGNLRGIFGHYKKVRLTLTQSQLERCNRIRCYFLAKDGDREVENWFRANDLVRCQTWNVLKTKRETFIPNLEEHDGNVYWWRKVHDVSWNTGVTRYVAKDAEGNPTGSPTTNPANAYVNEGGVKRLYDNGIYHTKGTEGYDDHQPVTIDGNTYHWFDVDYNYFSDESVAAAGSDIPAAGDKVIQFGNAIDPDRMNIYMIEVNGAGNPDAPDWKMYRGVYTFNLTNCWWGGESCRKTKWSVATGIEAYAPQFKWITEYGIARQVFVRDEVYWNKIPFERDDDWSKTISSYPDYSDDIVDANGRFVSRADGSPKNYVRKCRYYEQVSHNGSAWLCSVVESFYWRSADGRKIPAKTDGAEYVRNYTYDEPSAESNNWTEQVEKGDPGAFKSTVFCRSNSTPAAPNNDKKDGCNTFDNPVPPAVSGQPTWTDGIPDGTAILWASTAWFYSDGTHQNWTTPRPQTDTETLDTEFSPNATQPSAPYGTAANKDTASTKAQRHSQGWYDPNDTLPSGVTWSDMKWRAERKIKNGVYYGQWVISRIKGENSVRIDLDNENDSMLYTSGGTLVSGNVLSTARLFDGATDVSTSADWKMTAVGCTMSSGDSRNIVVTGMTAATGYVNVQAVYTDKNKTVYTKTTRLTLKKLVDVDKYDLDITPNSIAYNATKDQPATSVLTIKVWKMTVDGNRVLSNPPSGYGVYVNNVKQTASSTGTYSYTTDNSAVSSVQVKIAKDADLDAILDSETIPVNKAEDGAPGTSPYFADIDNEMDSVACDKNGKTLTAYDTTIGVSLWHGSHPLDITTLTTNSIQGFTITPDKTARTIRIQVQKGTSIAEVNKIGITIEGSGSGSLPLHFVLNGVRQGENGEPAVLYSLVPSVSSVVKKKDGTYSVDNVSCTRQKNVGGTITNNTTDGAITYKLDGGTEKAYTNNTDIAVTSFTKSIQFIFKVDGKVVDVETIPMVADGEDGVTPTVEIVDGYWVINDKPTGVKAEGTDGTGVEIKGTVASPSKMTIRNDKGYAIPMNDDGSDAPEVEVKHGDCYICNSDRHLYMFTSTPAVAWNDLGEFQGKPGKNSYMHIAYAKKNPLNVTTSTVDTIGFTVNSDGSQYEWMGFCTDDKESDPGRDWSSLSPSQKVAVVNAYKWNYMKGKDGSGYEYIYLLTKEGFKPTIDESSGQGSQSDDEFYPSVGNYQDGKIYGNSRYWNDNPPADISETWPVLWWASRKKSNGVWQAFGSVDLHNRYSKDGTGISSITRTFAISAVGTTASETTEPAHQGSWTTSSPAVTEQYPYLWAKEVVKYTDNTTTTKYYCIGSRGDNGVDAQDFEWVYVRTTNNVAPTIVAGSGTDYWKQDDFKPQAKVSSGRINGASEGAANVAVQCTDDPQGVTEEWQYEWEMKRTKGAADSNGHREWNNYTPGTAMTLHNNYAASNLLIDIDNDNDEFGADSESQVLVEQSRSTTVSMYYGKEEQTITALSAVLKYSDDDTSVPSEVAGVTTDLSTGNVVITIHQGTFSKSGLYALITAGCSLGTMKIRFTVTKLLGGTKGETPVIYQLDLTQKTLSYGRDASNNLVAISNSVTVRVKRTEGNDSQIKTLKESGKTCTWGYDGTYNSYTLNPDTPTITVPAADAGTHTKVSIALSTGDKENVTIVKDGANGAPGDTVRTVSIYQWSKTTPAKPTSTSIPPSGWSTTDSGTHDADALLWMCWGEAVNGVLTSDGWNGPVRMSGKDGDAGADGETYEYIYKQTNTLNGYGQHPKDIDTPDPHSTGQSKTDDDFVPDGWTDNPQGVSSSMKYEYCAIREKTKTGWSDFQDPFPWSVYGDKGQDGDGVQYIFKQFSTELNDEQRTANTPTREGLSPNEHGEWIPSGWSDDPVGTTSRMRYEYVSSIKRVGGTWGDFETITLWSKYSEDGKRGDFKSRVFARTDSDISNIRPTGGTYDSPLPSPLTQNGVTWSDGIPTGSAKIWTSVRTFKGDGTETTWSLPVLEGDSADLDVEFSLSETQPSEPTGSTPHADHSSEGWYDPSLNQTLPTGKTWSDMIWRAERRISGASYSGNWVISRIKGEQGVPATIEITEDGYWKINGEVLDVKAEGSDGTGVNIKGTVAAVTDMTVENNIGYVKPVGESKKAAEDGDSYVCEANRHLYIWLEAQKLWKDLGEFKGEPGKNSYVHIAYATGNPLNVTASTVNSIGFTVNNAGTEYDWWGFCTDNNVNDPGRNWSELTNAQKVEVVNTYKWNYMKGKDGDGVEYIYLLTKEGVVTPTIDATGYSGDHGDPTKDEFYPRVANYSPTTMQSNTWSDDPVDGVSRTWPLLWWAKREYDNGAWQAFKTAKLHARWSEDGGTPESRYQWNQDASNPPTYDANQQNPGSLWLTAPANRPGNGYYLWMITAIKSAAGVYGTWGSPVRLTGDTGSAGEDAKEREWVYKRVDANPGTPPSSGTGTVNGVEKAYSDTIDDWVPAGWQDNPLGVTNENKTEWASWRDFNKTTKKWGPFNVPFIWSHYGERGMDGDGVEYVFIRTNSNTAPTITNNNSYTEDGKTIDYTMDEFRPMTSEGRATDDPTGIDSTHKYEWVAMRTKGAPVNGVRTWNQYTLGAMALWAKYGDKGAPAGNTATVYLYKRSASAIASVGISTTLYYKFSSKKLYTTSECTTEATSQLNGWSLTIPSGTDQIYITAAVAYSNDSVDSNMDVDDIDKNEWVTPAEFNGADGINSATVFLYKRSASVPTGENACPSQTLYYKFANGELYTTADLTTTATTQLKGWQREIPATDGNPCYVIQAAALATGTYDAIEKTSTANDWSSVRKLVEDGAAGENAVRIDLDNQADLVSVDADGKVRFSRTVVVRARIFDGAAMVTDDSKVSHSMTKASMKIGSREPSSIVKSNGVITVQWDFSKGDSVTDQTKTFTLNYGGKGYSEEFTLGTTKSDVIYQLLPSPSEVSFSKGSDGKTLTPSQINLYGGYVKENGGAPVTVQQPNGSQIDSSNYLYYRIKGADGAWGAWTAYPASPNNFLQIASSTTNTDIEFCISTESDAGSVSDSNVVDRENVPIVKDGINGDKGDNSIRLALDNEHEDFLYNASGELVAPAGGATSQARLYDGALPISANSVTWAVDFSKSSGVPTEGQNAPTCVNGLLTVPHVTGASAKVAVKATYNSKDYFAEFTANKTEGDKYDIVVKPNAIPYNSSEAFTEKTINLSVKGIDAQGHNIDSISIDTSATPSAGKFCVFWGYVNANGSVGTLANLKASSKKVTAVECNTYAGIYFELRRYSDSTNYRLCDYETVEIAKVQNGDNGQSTFKSTVFTRTNETPLAPDATYGSYASPNPPESGSDMWPVKKSGGSIVSGTFWHDGIPAGEARLWASTRIFASDGQSPQQSSWTTPSPMTDTADFDVEFSSVANPNPPSGHPNTNTQWSNTSDATTIWMATSEKHNGVWSEWQVSKIKGEQGEPGGKATSKVQWFLALGGSTRPAVPTVNTDVIPPTSVIGGVTKTWHTGQASDPAWSKDYKYLYEIDYYTLSDGTGYWSEPFFLSEWAGQGPQGEAAWAFSANPANVIITQSLDNNLTSFSLATVSFAAKKGRESATITSIAIPTGQQALSNEFNATIGTGDDSKKVIVSSPKTHGTPEEYYTEGSFKVVVNAQAPDGSTSSQEVTVLCYANLLGTWKRAVVGDAESVAAAKVAYIYDPNNPNQVVKMETFGNYVRSSAENSAKLERDTTEIVKNIVNTDFEDIEGTQVALSAGEYIVQLKVDTEGLPTGNYVFDFAGFHYEGGEQFIEQRITVDNSGTYTITLHDEIQSGTGVATMLYIGRVFNVASQINQTADSISTTVKNISPSKNLLKGSLSAKGWSTSNAGAFTPNPGIKSAVLTADGYISMADTDTNTWLSKSGISLSTGKSYTLSFLAKVTTAISYKLFFVYNSQPQVVKEGTVPSVSSTTIRRKVTIENLPLASTAFYLTLNCNAIKQPQLEEGDTATDFIADSAEISSGIIQTADNIQLFVTQGLSNTGIDITNGNVDIVAGKVTFSYYYNGTKKSDKISINADTGTLKAVDVDLTGKITATSGAIGGFGITGSQISSLNNNIILKSDGSATIGVFSVATNQTRVTGNLIVGSGSQQRTIEILPSTSWGAAVVGKNGNTEMFRFGFFNVTGGGYEPVLKLTDSATIPTEIKITNEKIEQNIVDIDDSQYSILQGLITQVGNQNIYGTKYAKGNGADTGGQIIFGMNGSNAYLRAIQGSNGDSAWPVCRLDPNGANWMDKGHVHVMTMAELKVLLANPNNTYYNHLKNYAVMLTRINDN